MIRKLWIGISLLALSFLLFSCTKPEYVIEVDEQLEAHILDDQFRTYYEIFVGSFSDSNKDGLGDLKGMTNRLDYLNDGDPNSGKSLGIDGIWLMPIMESPSYHKYDVADYMSIDKDYGTLEDFENFVDEADSRGINVIIDLVLNHTSMYHTWFKQAKTAINAGDLTNPYIEYYSLVKEDGKEPGKTYYPFAQDYFYEANFSQTMPELNMDSLLVKAEIIDILQFWFDLGVSGFRLDAIKYVYLNDTQKNLDFWSWFIEECIKINPDAYIVGEVWSGDALIAPYYANFSNFDFGMSQLEGAVASTANAADAVNNYVSYLNNYRNMIEDYSENPNLTPFISNHDMNRSAGYLNVPDYRMHMAANLYIWSYGTPFLYYGEEIGMKGSRGTESTDANRRLKMLWGDKDTVIDPVGSTYDIEKQTNGTVKDQLNDPNSLFNHYKKVIMIRNANPEIARGTYTPLTFTGYFTFGGFLSTYQDSTVGVFHNTGETAITIELSLYTDYTFTILRGFAGKGVASLSNQFLTIDGLTSVVIK